MNRFRIALAMGAAALQLLSAIFALAADDRPRIAIVMAADSRQLAARIATELGTMGFDVLVAPHAVASVQELGELTRRSDAVAGAWIAADGEGIRIWVVDRTTDKTLTRELPAAAQMEATIALRAVELLRASLLELALPGAPKGERAPTTSLLEAAGVPEAETPVTPSAASPIVLPAPPFFPRKVERRRALLALELGPALVGASGDLSPFPALLVGAAYCISPELSLGAIAFAPLSSVSHSASEGRSESRIALLALEAGWQPARGLLRPFLRIGPSTALLRTRGETTGALLEGASSTALTFGAVARGGATLEIISGLHLRPQAAAGVQHRYFSLEYAGRSAARWGAPWWALSLALEAQLFQ